MVLRLLGWCPASSDDAFAPDRLDPGEERSRLLDVMAGFLAGRCAEGPVVLVLDDLQWADVPSLSMLRHVVARTAGCHWSSSAPIARTKPAPT